jgi:hypothetical protein
MPFDRSQILATSKPKVTSIDIPEWGGTFYLRPMSGLNRERLETAYMAKKANSIRAMTVAFCLCDAEGNYVFTESDVDQLNETPASVLLSIFEKAEGVSAIDAKAIEDLAKN